MTIIVASLAFTLFYLSLWAVVILINPITTSLLFSRKHRRGVKTDDVR